MDETLPLLPSQFWYRGFIVGKIINDFFFFLREGESGEKQIIKVHWDLRTAQIVILAYFRDQWREGDAVLKILIFVSIFEIPTYKEK